MFIPIKYSTTPLPKPLKKVQLYMVVKCKYISSQKQKRRQKFCIYGNIYNFTQMSAHQTQSHRHRHHSDYPAWVKTWVFKDAIKDWMESFNLDAFQEGGSSYIPEGSLAASLRLTVTGPVFSLYTPNTAFPPFFNRTTAQYSKTHFKTLVGELSVILLRLSGTRCRPTRELHPPSKLWKLNYKRISSS